MSYGNTPPPGGPSDSGQDPSGPPQDPQNPQNPVYGTPPPPSYGAPQPPAYGAPQQPAYGAQQPPAYGAPPANPYGSAPSPYGSSSGPAYGAAPPPTGNVTQANNGLIEIAGLGTVKLATLLQRFLARLIDGVIVGVVVGILYGVGIGAAVSTSTTDQYGNTVPSGAGLGTLFALLGVALIITLLYEVVMIALRGQTVGKMVIGVKVVRQENGQVPGWGPSFIRWVIPSIASAICGLGIIVYLSPLFDGSGRMQGWHDKAANDVVIFVK